MKKCGLGGLWGSKGMLWGTWGLSGGGLGDFIWEHFGPKERTVVPKMRRNEGPGRAWGPPGELLHRSGGLWVVWGGLRGVSGGAEGAERGRLEAMLVRRWGHSDPERRP